jgi:hypothetical protein
MSDDHIFHSDNGDFSYSIKTSARYAENGCTKCLILSKVSDKVIKTEMPKLKDDDYFWLNNNYYNIGPPTIGVGISTQRRDESYRKEVEIFAAQGMTVIIERFIRKKLTW